MYNNPYMVNNPYMPKPMTPPTSSYMPMSVQQVVKVNGRNGAEMYQMPPNSSALLLDENLPVVWLATTDGAGYKSITAYDIKPHEEVPPVDMKSIEERITKLEEIIANGKPDFTSNQRTVTNEPIRANPRYDGNGKRRTEPTGNDG